MDKIPYYLGYPKGTSLPGDLTSLSPTDQASINTVLARLEELDANMQQVLLDSVASEVGQVKLSAMRAYNMQRIAAIGLVGVLSRLTGMAIQSNIYEIPELQWRVPG